ncbi:MAG: M4 family metallopeptidase [Phycisphaerales bacterium]|nr:M4 family metallopeptidase [Phycisphaerales bacterium]
MIGLLLIAIGAHGTAALAQQAPRELNIRRSPVTGLATFVTAADGTTFAVPPTGGRAQAIPLDFFVVHGALFGVTRPAEELRLERTRTDALGQVHTTYRQVYRDVPVFTGELKVHQDAGGGFRAVNGDFFPVTGKLNVRPALSADAAAMIARANLLAGNATIASSALTIVDPGWYGDSPRGEHLAWQLELVDAAHEVAEAFLIDAHSGEVLDQWSLIQHARDRAIYDGGGGAGLPGVLVRAEGDPATGIFDEDAAYDYYGDTYDYFARAFGRDGIDGAGLTMVATVNSTAPRCPNAFWTDLLQQMVFCDDTVTDDIVGHELTHGVTSSSTGLIYQNQPGQLNESFSDVFGELIDLFNGDAAFVGVIGGPPSWPAHATGAGLDAPNNARTACSFSPAHTDGVRWLLGEDAVAFGGAIRDMWDPTCYDDPDRAGSALQSCSNGDNGGVHSGSGVPNHAFAMLTDGKSFNGYTVAGIGPIKAGAVWYRALTVYLTSGADFEDAYWAFNQAAADLVGTTPNDPRTGGPSASAFTAADALEVDKALLAVEMNTPGRCGDEPPVISAVPPAECTGQTLLFAEDFESGLAGWSVSHSATPTSYDWITTSGLPFARPGSAAFGADLNSSCAFGPDESGVVHLDSPVINLSGTLDFPTLSFTHFMDSEANWDGGNVRISVNAGPWQLLPASAFYYNAYNRKLFTAGQGNSNPLAGQEAFTGSGGQWGTSLVYLGGLVSGGEAIRIRFTVGKDGCSGTDGWYVDDVRIYDCAGAGDCNGNGIPDEVETIGGGHLDVGLSNPSGHGSGYFSDADLGPSGFVFVRAQYFTLFAPTTIEGIRFWGGYYPNNTPPTDDLAVIFHADDGGSPGSAVSTQLSVPATRTLSGFSIAGVDEWEFVIELPNSVSLAAGDYWIEIFNDTTGDDDTFFWSGSTYSIGLVGNALATEAPGVSWSTFILDPDDVPIYQTFNLAIELHAGVVGTDCDANGIPDECEPAYDCNGNGVRDSCEIASATSDDCNANGFPDECDLKQRKLGGTNSSFYLELNAATGGAMAVSGLGLGGFGNVAGLAYDPNADTLYGTDTTSDQLVIIDPDTGAASAVGALGFASVSGLAFDPVSSTLYGSDTTTDQLITIDPVTGAGAAIGALGFASVSGLAFNPTTGVLYGTDTSSDQLIVIDPLTGAGTAVGALGFGQVEGLAFDPVTGTLYGSDPVADQLLTINPATGAATPAGSLAFGSVQGLAANPGTGVLYGADTSTDQLISIVPDVSATAVGPLGFSTVTGLAFNPNTNQLYGVDGTTDRLLLINKVTGAGTSIGIIGFGGVEGLAFNPNTNTLYGTDTTTDQLITINRFTGQGTAVGPLGFNSVFGLAFDPNTNTLYGTDIVTDQLITINRFTGHGTAVGPLGFNSVYGLDFDPNTNTLLGTDISTDQLITINTATGQGSAASGLGFPFVAGLGFDSNTDTLYGSDIGLDQLIVIDPPSDLGAAIGVLGFAQVEGLAYNPGTGKLFGTETNKDQLIIIDPVTGSATTVGPLGYSNVQGLAFDPLSGTLYGTDVTTDQLIAINPVTGAGTAIGALGFSQVSGLAYDPTTGTLFGTDVTTDQLITIDLLTGAGSAVGPLGFGGVFGLAFDAATGTLYGADPFSDELIIINPNTGAGTLVGGPISVLGLAFDSANGVLFGSFSQLTSIDPATGQGTAVGELGFSSIHGLAFDPISETVFGSDINTDQLIAIDPETGAGRTVGALGFDQVEGLAFDPDGGALYGTDVATDQLIFINPMTGASAIVGALGFGNVYGLAYDSESGTLYGTDIVADELIIINRLTGAGTTVGPLGFGSVQGLVYHAGTGLLYGTDTATEQLVRIDPATGHGTIVGPTQFADIFGLALVESANDCNANAAPDECDIASGISEDCNANGTPDECEIDGNDEDDCNANGVPDECDIATGTSDDCNANGTPDECETDCNANGIADVCEIASGTSDDCNANSIPDECDLANPAALYWAAGSVVAPVIQRTSIGSPDIVDVITDIALGPYDVAVDGRGERLYWAQPADLPSLVTVRRSQLDGSAIEDVILAPELSQPESIAIAPVAGKLYAIDGDSIRRANLDGSDVETVLTDNFTDCLVDGGTELAIDELNQHMFWITADDVYRAGLDGSGCDVVIAKPTSGWTNAHLALDPPDARIYVHQRHISTELLQSFIRTDLDGGGNEPLITSGLGSVADIQIDVPSRKLYWIEPNGVFRANLDGSNMEIVNSSSLNLPRSFALQSSQLDCNDNGELDECEAANCAGDPACSDCNANGSLDECDLAGGLSADCNSNGVPDECDVDPVDPDVNGVISADCNSNGTPDECEADCDNDGTPDQCEVEHSVFAESFDAYALGSNLNGQGGWKGWDDNPAAGAPVTADQAHTGQYAVDISGDADLVHEFSGATAGQWTLTIWQYVPAAFDGDSTLILLNTYSDGGPKNWSTQVRMNSTSQEVISDPAGVTLPLITDQWVSLRVEIDLDANTQTLFYDGELLTKRSWTDGLSAFGVPDIAAVDLFANGGTSIYYDDLSLVERINDCNANGVPDDCDLAEGASLDCDANGVPDECDAAIDDCNTNGIPDICEPDCDSNGTIDACEIVRQPRGFGAFGIIAQVVPASTGFDDFNTKEWDDFTLAEDTLLTTGRASFTVEPGYSAVTFIVEIASAPGGEDAGHVVWLSAVGVYDDASGVVSFDFGAALLPAGTYWISVHATDLIPSNQQVFWRRSNVLHPHGSEHWVHNFGGGFGVGPFPILGSSFAGSPADLAWALDAIDCDENGLPDECEPASSDCNLNGIPDVCDVSTGVSGDCNTNGIPDECDIAAGTSQDCQPDGYPDECQLAHPTPLISQPRAPTGGEFSDCFCDYCSGSQVIADQFVLADRARVGSVRFWGVYFDPDDPGPAPNVTIIIHEDDGGLPGAILATYVNPATQRAMTGETVSGSAEWQFDCILDPCLPLDLGTYWIEIQENTDVTAASLAWRHGELDAVHGLPDIAYDHACPAVDWAAAGFGIEMAFELFDGPCAPPAGDCNSNGVPDSCDPDCNANGSPDACDIAVGTSTDCNLNGAPDACDLAGGISSDCNSNSIPDECDLAAGTSEDCNTNGVSDVCDINYCPSVCGGVNEGFEAGDFTGWQVQDLASPSVPIMVDGSGTFLWILQSDPTEGDFACLHGFSGSSPGTIRISQDFAVPAHVTTLMFDYRAAWIVSSGSGDRTFSVNIEPAGGGTPWQTDVILVASAGTSVADTGHLTGAVDVSAFAGSVVRVAFEWFVPDTLPLGGFQLDNIRCHPAQPCVSSDCNANGTPDECEADCNANGAADACDVAAGTSVDADFNGVPDECENPSQDCNSNGMDDLDDIAFGNSDDCNTNGTPDECELAAGGVPSGFALEFDGVNDHVLIPSTPDLRPLNNFTIEAWINVRQLGGVQSLVFHDEDGGGDDGYALVILADGRARFSASNANGFGNQNVVCDDILTIDVNQWHHVAGVYDNSVLKVYVDGQETSKPAAGDVAYTVTDSLNLGRRGGTNSPNTNFLSGQIDEVRFWNVVRSPAEIAAHMNTTLVGDELGLVAYWRADEGAGMVLVDSADAHDGALVNGPLWTELPPVPSGNDCNLNAMLDECELQANDCDSNGIPDDCQPDSDGDGTIDACDACAGGAGSGDADGDGDIDGADAIAYGTCLTGPEGSVESECACFDFDLDGDNDLLDFAEFQTLYGL